MRIGLITRHDLISGRQVGGGLAYRRQLFEVLKRSHDVELVEIKVRRRRGVAGKVRTQLELAHLLQQVEGEKDLWIRDFRELGFLGPLRTRGRNIVVVHHIDPSPLPNRRYNELLDRLCRRRLAEVDTVVTVSRYWQQRLRQWGVSDVRVIYNSIDPLPPSVLGRSHPPATSAAEGERFRDTHHLSSQPIIYVGNCQPAKGAALACEILSGEGYELVTSGTRQLDLSCPNLEIPYEGYLELLRMAEAAVLLSQFDEGWCRTAHEAMLCATPVIGSGRGGMRELLEGGGQFITEDADEIRTILRRLLEEPAWARTIGERGRTFALQFTRERFAREWLALVEGGAQTGVAEPSRTTSAVDAGASGAPPLVSIILPVHNREHSIAECLESILIQTYQPFEVIVLDDGSTDRTPSILATYGDRIRVIRQDNAGPYVARNRALEEARGEYLAFADSDDRLHPERLARQVARLEKDRDLALVYTYIAYRNAAGERWDPPAREQVGLEGDLSRTLIASFGGNIPWPTAMIRRSALEKAGPFDVAHRVAMDRELGMRLAQVGPFAVLREPLYEYTLHDEHISQQVTPREEAASYVLEKIRRGEGLYSAYRQERWLHKQAGGRMWLQLARLAYGQWMFGRSIRHCCRAVGVRTPLLWQSDVAGLCAKAILGSFGLRRLRGAVGRSGRRRWQPQSQSAHAAKDRGAVSRDAHDEED